MELERLDDYQSWGLDTPSGWILIDPWLTGTCTLPGGQTLFKRTHRCAPSRSLEDVRSPRAIFLTAHFGDHLHAETLQALCPQTPVYSTKWGVKEARKLGFQNCTSVKAGETVALGEGLEVHAVGPAFPYAHNSLGFLFTSTSGPGIYFETHGIRAEVWEELNHSVDILVTAVETVRLLGIPLTLGQKRLLQCVQKSEIKRFIPSGTEPERASGFLPTLLFTAGSISAFGEAMAELCPQIAYSPMAVGERLSLR